MAGWPRWAAGAAATEVLGGRQATSLLTRATWIAGSGFMALALVLAIMSSRSATPESVLEGIGTPSQSAPEPLLPSTEASPSLVPSVEIVPPDAEPSAGEAVPPPDGNEPPDGLNDR